MIINQLRRNVFNLDLKREIVAAKTNVKHFFSSLILISLSMVQKCTRHNLAHFLNMCILLRLPGWDKAINTTLKKPFLISLNLCSTDVSIKTRLINFVSLIMTV